MISDRKLIVDTHYLIWDMMGHLRFTQDQEAMLTQKADDCYFSSISYWEIGMLISKGRIKLPVTLDQFVSDLRQKRGYKTLPITPKIGDITSKFSSLINGDPADRIIAATAIAHDAMLMTADENLRSLPFLTIAD